MKIVRFNNIKHLPENYEKLFSKNHALTFDQTEIWYHAFIEEALEPNYQPILYGVESDNGEPLGLMPMCYRQETGLRQFLPRQLCSLTNYYTSLFSPLICSSRTSHTVILCALFRHLAKETPKWNTINLEPMDNHSKIYTEISEILPSQGMVGIPYFRFGNWYLELRNRDFTEYFNSLPTALKNTLRRKRKKLFSSANTNIDIITDITRLDSVLSQYEEIYKKSWKTEEPFPRFIRRIAHEYARKGCLRLGIIYIGDSPAAAQIWFVKDGIASIFKLAYDPQFREYSVGSVLTMHLMQHVIDIDGVKKVDYLVGDDPYKKDWMTHRQERWGIMAFNVKTPKGALAAARHIGTRKIRELISHKTHPR